MRIVKKIFIGLAALIALLLVTALFVKNDCAAEREITINKPKDQVFAYVKSLKNQDNFSKWATMDPKMKKEYKGVDGTPGFVSAWESKQSDVGKGEQQIIKVDEGERIDFALHFIEPFEGKATAFMTTEPLSENSTKVKWGFQSRTAYPMNLMLLFMDMDKLIGNDLQAGLNNLKTQLEK